jgi:hypothetical protein
MTIALTSVHNGPTTLPNTRAALACLAAAGPLYAASGLAQALTRDGFDPTRHPLSILSNGPLGWIQISTFLVAGALTILGSRGLPAGWGRRLVALYGIGLIGAGAFVADPMDGFPVGTPGGPPAVVSWHGTMHFVAGGIGFVGLIAACLVFARRFAAAGDTGWARYSTATGVLYTAAFVGIASGSPNPAVTLGFYGAVALGWAWLTLLALRTRRAAR